MKFDDHAPISFYDAAKDLGLQGATTTRMFPAFQTITNAQGGMKDMGPGSNRNLFYSKPTSNASATWVKSNHTYKGGAEMRIEAYPGTLYTATNGIYTFSGTINSRHSARRFYSAAFKSASPTPPYFCSHFNSSLTLIFPCQGFLASE